MSAEQERLEAAIGYSFRDPGLLRRALTHKSYAHEQPPTPDAVLADNEQLEFLGDAVLGFLASELLVNRFPALAEGRLSKLKARLVSADHLHSVALSLDLGRYLVLGKGEEMSGGRAKPALLADALEAFLAAIYLDAGLEEVRGFMRRFVVIGLDSTLPLADYKSAVQEAAQARGLPTPRYITVRERGPEHAKSFTVEVRVGSDWSAEAEERSKKSAGQKAAQLLLAKLQQGV
jgi:ribonuclease-3